MFILLIDHIHAIKFKKRPTVGEIIRSIIDFLNDNGINIFEDVYKKKFTSILISECFEDILYKNVLYKITAEDNQDLEKPFSPPFDPLINIWEKGYFKATWIQNNVKRQIKESLIWIDMTKCEKGDEKPYEKFLTHPNASLRELFKNE